VATFIPTISSAVVASAIALTAPAFASEQPALAASFEAVCASPFVKSDKLQAACATNAMPAALKDGTRFKAVGIGAEVNTLVANLHLVSSR